MMSYCRFGKDSDLYMYHSGSGYCFHLAQSFVYDAGKDFVIEKAEDALRRLKRLKTQGYKIPDRAIKRLESEIKGD
ncbi:hypothetical protein [Ralstonia phage RSP15]|uniref:hypothetical protein n=1 Tax=Ralstonia phage RSP15 TaxID=1785960 RepID=UPI00074D3B8C|nr:hypothetical protein BH754_gp243 [Ralstonia phage RSP15]BAU40063.1 hypothetical protein [Ralstonia phage RSP15]